MEELNTDPSYSFIYLFIQLPTGLQAKLNRVLNQVSFPVCSIGYLIMCYNSSCWLQADKKAPVSQSECVMWKKILVALRSLYTWRVFMHVIIFFQTVFTQDFTP